MSNLLTEEQRKKTYEALKNAKIPVIGNGMVVFPERAIYNTAIGRSEVIMALITFEEAAKKLGIVRTG